MSDCVVINAKIVPSPAGVADKNAYWLLARDLVADGRYEVGVPLHCECDSTKEIWISHLGHTLCEHCTPSRFEEKLYAAYRYALYHGKWIQIDCDRESEMMFKLMKPDDFGYALESPKVCGFCRRTRCTETCLELNFDHGTDIGFGIYRTLKTVRHIPTKYLKWLLRSEAKRDLKEKVAETLRRRAEGHPGFEQHKNPGGIVAQR